jgi:hypothetical protein
MYLFQIFVISALASMPPVATTVTRAHTPSSG